jgi:hypothetical protein
VALEVAAETIGSAVIDVLRRRRPALAHKAEAALEWLREAAEPPRGIELRAADGSLYTGFVIVERNKPVLMLAVRQQAGPVVERTPLVTPPPVQRPLYGQPRLDPEAPYWDRDSGPYGSSPYDR